VSAVTRHRPGRDEEGAAVVEFAAIFGLFLLLVWGIITYGVIFAAKQAITHAASEGALAGANVEDPDGVVRDVVAAQLEWLTNFGFDPYSSDVTVGAGGCAECLEVTVSYGWRADPIVPAMLDIATPERLSSTAVVKTW
jgi:Flp pilus assembly pilin Flp